MSPAPREHAEDVRTRLHDLVERLRSAIADTDDPHAEALFETSAEVLEGLAKAHAHYMNASEEAWRS